MIDHGPHNIRELLKAADVHETVWRDAYNEDGWTQYILEMEGWRRTKRLVIGVPAQQLRPDFDKVYIDGEAFTWEKAAAHIHELEAAP